MADTDDHKQDVVSITIRIDFEFYDQTACDWYNTEEDVGDFVSLITDLGLNLGGQTCAALSTCISDYR